MTVEQGVLVYDGDKYIVRGPCWSCQEVIAYNPHKVPSAVIDGQREPLCPRCVTKWNAREDVRSLGNEILVLEGAYDWTTDA